MFDFDTILEPYREIQKVFDSLKGVSNIANATKAVYLDLQHNLDEIKKSMKIIEQRNLLIGNSMIPKFFENFQEIGKRFKENLEKTPQSIMLLSKYGWYLNFESELYLPIQLGKLIQTDKVEEVDKILMDYYGENLDRIQDDLINKYPGRKEIFRQIVAAHKEKKYYLSITCILTQVDGICFDTTTKKYFITVKQNKKFKFLPEVVTEFVNISGSICEAFSLPIFNKTAINCQESDIENFPVKLNRHLILHGVDKDFGTEKNSLKCLSLLAYLSDMLSQIDVT